MEDDDPELAHAPPAVNIVATPLPRTLATDPELAHVLPAYDVVAAPTTSSP